ncbi:unnamed protein product, partial [Meganyctiphanes norvegica]
MEGIPHQYDYQQQWDEIEAASRHELNNATAFAMCGSSICSNLVPIQGRLPGWCPLGWLKILKVRLFELKILVEIFLFHCRDTKSSPTIDPKVRANNRRDRPVSATLDEIKRYFERYQHSANKLTCKGNVHACGCTQCSYFDDLYLGEQHCLDIPNFLEVNALIFDMRQNKLHHYVSLAQKLKMKSSSSNNVNNSKKHSSDHINSSDKKLGGIIDQLSSSTVLRDKNEYSDDDVYEPSRYKAKEDSDRRKKEKESKLLARKKKEVNRTKKRKGRHESESSNSDSDSGWNRSGTEPKQCFGPQCIHAARPNSKYCSEECGLNLAKARIYSVLPQRIQEWKMSQCVAEQKDIRQLEKIRKEQQEAHKILQQLDLKHKDLDMLLSRGKSITIDPKADIDFDDETSEASVVYCITCGHEVTMKRALKHFESCFNKLESQTTFGSMYKTRIEGNNMFCDAYTNGTYCKRLRVMCPEHSKEPKVLDTEVCGCPIVINMFEETDELCRSSKKKCMRHFCWEKLRRAEIDMERVRQWLKLDELLEQERTVRTAMTNRAGVLGLMLHSTYDHPLAEKLQSQQYSYSMQQHASNQQHQHHPQSQPAKVQQQKHKQEKLTKKEMSSSHNDHQYHSSKDPQQQQYKHSSSGNDLQQQSSVAVTQHVGDHQYHNSNSAASNNKYQPHDHLYHSNRDRTYRAEDLTRHHTDHQYFSNKKKL